MSADAKKSVKIKLPPALLELRNKAMALQAKGQLDAALACYRSYLAQVPGDAGTWSNLGVALRSMKAFDASIIAQRRAIELSPDEGAYWSNLGNALKDADRLEEACEAQRRSVKLEPGSASRRHNLSVSLREAGHFDEALVELERAIRLEPNEAKYRWDRGYVMLHQQRFPEAWIAYEWRYRLPELGGVRREIPRWLGEPFVGKRLLVTPEQGFGDTIFAARFLPLVKARGGEVLLVTKGPLQRPFTGMPGVDVVVPHEGVPPRVDYICSLMDLPRIFAATPETSPVPAQLQLDAAARAKASELLRPAGKRFTVGVVWSGSVTFKNNRKRATSAERFLSLAEVPGVQLVSLQKGPCEEELDHNGLAVHFIDVGRQVKDFAESAAVIDALDLVVMTDSSVAHVAGSLGKPIWNLLNYVPYWLYNTTGETTAWYPSMRFIRQPRPGDWDSVFAAAKRGLAKAVQAKAAGQWPSHVTSKRRGDKAT